jgi:DDE superfamily endonuclease
VTAAQLREVVARLIAAGHWKDGDPPVIIVMDSGYSPVRLAWLLADLPVVLVARVRCDRVFYTPPPPRVPGIRGRTARHGEPVRCGDPATWHSPDLEARADSARHGPLAVTAWARVHQMIHRGCGGWEDWPARQEFPLIEGTLIRLAVTRPAPGYAALEPMWLWASAPDAGRDGHAAGTLWQAYLRRFDLEHMFRFLRQQLGWDRPLLRDPAAADRWTWLLIACCAQLCLARELAADIRLPWQRPQAGAGKPRAMTPGRVRAGFRLVRETVGTPAGVGKCGKPGPGRPKGSANKHKAPRYPVGKTSPKQRKPAKNPRKKAKQTG